MKRIILLTFFSLFLFGQLSAQHKAISITGKVLTADGQPAAGLLITITGTKNISYTQNDGAFKIYAFPGEWELIIASGLGNYKQTIAVTNEALTLPVIALKEKAFELKEVVVTAQYGPQSLRNSVYNIRTISAERIKLRAATNVQQVLNTEFGFRFSNDLTLGTTDVEMMGVTGRSIKILLDGVPLIDRSDARESLNQIDINTIERIEIVEGPMSVIYGTDALAGVINIITKNAGNSLFTLSARSQEETAGDEYEALRGKGSHIQNINASWQKNGWSVLAGATHTEFGGWNLAPALATTTEVQAVTNRWRPKEQYMGNAKVGYRNNNFNIWYRFDGLEEKIESKGGMNPSNYKAKFQTYTTNRFTQQLQSEWKASPKLAVTAIAGYTDLQRGTRSVIHDFTDNSEVLTTDAGEQDVAKFKSIIFRTTAQYVVSKMVSVQPGFEFNRDEATGARIKGTPNINDYAFFLSAEIKPISSINIRPGLRFTANSVYDAPAVLPSLNTKFGLTKNLDLRLAYARGFRAPALRELYFDFFDASHSIRGNENLAAEESNSFNASLAWSAIQRDELQFKTTFAGFYTKFKNFIGFGQDPNDASIMTLTNFERFKTTGFSVDNTVTFKNLQANIAFSYIGRYNRINGDQTLDIPTFSWTPEITTNLSYAFPKINGSVSLFYKYTGVRPGYELLESGTTSTLRLTEIGAFNWADLMLNKNVYKNITINAGVKNLFNVTQLTNSATASGGAHSTGGSSVPYSYGRSYVLGLTYNWNKN